MAIFLSEVRTKILFIELEVYLTMVELNLPDYGPELRKSGDRVEIYDVIRRKYLKLTPEEWVRQHMIHYLHSECGYPFSMMSVEGGLTYNQRIKRTDIVVYNRSGEPCVLVECKSYKMKKMGPDVFYQAAAYNRELKARWLILTNGWGYHCLSIQDNKITQQEHIPPWGSLL